jgi:AcrR family transcriptional regulator
VATNDLNAKGRILKAIMELLQETENLEDITVRDIALRAQVGVGSINYHFRSKDNLMNEAVGQLIGDQASGWYQSHESTGIDPVERLKMLLKDTSNIAFRYPKLSRIAISHSLLEGHMEPALLILPLLREIFGDAKDEVEIRQFAFQLIVSTQVMFLRAEEFRLYMGVNIFDQNQRDKYTEILVDNLVNQ